MGSAIKDELYGIALTLERFASSGLREGPQKELREIVDRIIEVAKSHIGEG